MSAAPRTLAREMGEADAVAVANETVAIGTRGTYVAPSGATVSIADAVAAAIAGTRLYAPGEYDALAVADGAGPPVIEVTPETTGAASRRLVASGHARVAALNFASGRNPGGGFLRGTKAQEEDLSRCSALYACQITKPAYYAANRASESILSTDHLIYSPDVPFFRDESLQLLEAPFVTSILTSPAPKLSAPDVLGEIDQVPATIERRVGHILAVASAHGHRVLVLGAWGCGVYRNDPHAVAAVFATHLASARFRGAFSHLTFAVYDRKGETRAAFEERFRPSAPRRPS